MGDNERSLDRPDLGFVVEKFRDRIVYYSFFFENGGFVQLNADDCRALRAALDGDTPEYPTFKNGFDDCVRLIDPTDSLANEFQVTRFQDTYQISRVLGCFVLVTKEQMKAIHEMLQKETLSPEFAGTFERERRARWAT